MHLSSNHDQPVDFPSVNIYFNNNNNNNNKIIINIRLVVIKLFRVPNHGGGFSRLRVFSLLLTLAQRSFESVPNVPAVVFFSIINFLHVIIVLSFSLSVNIAQMTQYDACNDLKQPHWTTDTAVRCQHQKTPMELSAILIY